MGDELRAEATEHPRPVPAADLGAAVRAFLGHRGPRLLAAQAAALVVARARRRGFDRRDAALVAAVGLWWPVQEWVAHKHVLHARPRSVGGRTIDPAVARHHRRHHADPWNPEHTLLPTWFLLPAVPVHLLAWAVLVRDRRRALTGAAAFATATLGYEWIHFLTHTGYRPRRSWYRTLQRRHRLHHFKHEQLWFGFTVPYVDDAMGTAPDPATVEASPTVRTLGIVEPA